MIRLDTWKKAWAVLDRRERRNGFIVLGVMVVAAASSAVMVGSVMPFLAVLADPARIHSVGALSWIYDTFGFRSDFTFLVFLGASSIALIVIASVIQALRTYMVNRWSTMRGHSLSHRVLGAYLARRYEFFLDHHTANMGTQILNETQQLVSLFYRPAADMIASGLTVLAVLGLLIWVNPLIATTVVLAFGGFYGVTFFLARRRLSRLGKRRHDANRARARIAQEALHGVKYIKLVGREGDYLARYETPSRILAEAQAETSFAAEIPQYVLQIVTFGGIILLCLALLDPVNLGTSQALSDILPLLGVMALAGQRLMPEFYKVYRGLTQVQAAAAVVDSVHGDLSGAPVGPALSRQRSPRLGLREELRLEGVTYKYPSAERASLSDVSLSIRAGETIGIMGSTGSGKTTLADIVLGLLQPSSGRVVVDGTPIGAENLRSWQQSLGYVPQEIFLTDATVSENIAFGVPPAEIDQAKVERAAQLSQLHDLIVNDLPEGYRTRLGDRGVRLSGGQRQRVGIARALYHDADLIMLDEATSALDNLTEREVMAAIDALPEGKTILMIAHRLTTLHGCDRILVLDKGEVTGFAGWEELLATNATVRSLANHSHAA